MSAPQTMFDTTNTTPNTESVSQSSHQEPVNNTVPEVPTDPYAGMLQGIVNTEGQPKYATVSDALSALSHAQKHIADLEERNTSLTAVADKVNTFEQRLTEMQTQGTPEPVAQQLDTETLAKVVNQTIDQRSNAAAKQQNLLAVDKSLQDTFGTEAPQVLQAKATELGMSLETMKGLAETSPQAVLAYFNTTSQPPANNTSPPTSTLRTGDIPTPVNDKPFHRLTYTERKNAAAQLREDITKSLM